MILSVDTKVGTIATEHPLSTRVFARHGIDFCCRGGLPLVDACRSRGVEVARVLRELDEEINAIESLEVRWYERPLAELIEHILQEFHEPLEVELPRIEAMARKVDEVYGEEHPARFQSILTCFIALRTDLEQHMRKEERILFPMILDGNGHVSDGPVAVIEMEHEQVGAMLRRLRDLTDDYRVPDEACSTWRALWAALEELERSLHEHIHLENNILHPRALAGC